MLVIFELSQILRHKKLSSDPYDKKLDVKYRYNEKPLL